MYDFFSESILILKIELKIKMLTFDPLFLYIKTDFL